MSQLKASNMRNSESAVVKSKETAKGYCEICNTETNNLSNHVKFKHVKSGEIESLQEYYHRYILKSEIRPVCLNCGSETEFISINKGYKRTCSHKCSMNAKEIKDVVQSKAKEGVKKKFGVKNISQVEEVKLKKKETFQKNYEKDHIWCNKEGETRSCDLTNLKRYGFKSPLKSREIRERIWTTNFMRYGSISPSSDPAVKERARKTIMKNGGFTLQRKELVVRIKLLMKERYGAEYSLSSPVLAEKIRKTMLKRYGVQYPSQYPKFITKGLNTKLKRYGSRNNIEKIKKTLMERYGVENMSQVPEFHQRAQINNSLGKHREYITNIEGRQVACSSFLEKRFVHYCDSKNIVVERGDCVPYTGLNGKDKIYHCDFKIKEVDGRWRLVETKGNHKWWFKDLESGLVLRKIEATKLYSEDNNYHEFLILLDNQLKKTNIRDFEDDNNIYNKDVSNCIQSKEKQFDSILFNN